MYRKTYVEVNLDNINRNVSNIVNTFNGYEYYIGIVKGNAYGHGEYISKYIIQNGINYLAVSSLEEAINVRNYVDKDYPILCLEPISLDYIDDIIKYNVTISVCNLEYYNKLVSFNLDNIVKFHLKLNTGMNRLGISNIEEVNYIFNNSKDNLIFEGIFTHLATDGVNDNLLEKQINNFKYLTSEIDLSKIKIVHIGKSATLEYFPKLDFCNGVRLGIMMYGVTSFNNSKSIKDKLLNLTNKKNKLIPYSDKKITPIQSLSLKSEVVDIHKVSKGDHIGYGDTNVVNYDGYIAILPIGYADGLQFKYKDWYVTINNKKYMVVGSIMMGMVTVLVDDSVKIGDVATLIDANDDFNELAKKFDTSPYVLMTNLHRELPRVYVFNNKIVDIIEK